MDYQVEGILTKKQRKVAEDFVRSYFALVGDKSISAAERILAEGVFRPWMLLCKVALYVDEVKMMEKVIGGHK